ncbi:hypothetical protein [Corynebacterium sp. H130]|uniref:hypothetical protein n=1 Tax=Corynebacterium sp. H130 TaxID=3133444 RepID=UPI0030B7487F
MPIRRNYSRYPADLTVYSDIKDFLSVPTSDGLHAIGFDGSFLDIMVENRSASTTIVIFHGAVNPNETSLPLFVGKNTVADVDANVVYVCEPALERGSSIGWYAGIEGTTLQDDLVRIIAHVQDSIPNAKHLVFFGPSAGGFAALYYSHCFPGSLAVVGNPQTNINRYYANAVKMYRDACWSGNELADSNCTFDLTELYAQSFPNFVAYFQNQDDDFHIANHLNPWRDAVANHDDRWKLVLGDWGEGHSPVPRMLLMGILGFAAAVDGNWAEFFADELFEN